VIYGALEHGHPWLYFAGVLTAGITAYYMFRMLFVTFFGPYRGGVPNDRLAMPPAAAHTEPAGHDSHAPDWVMQLPVAILIVPTIAAGYLSVGFGGPSPWSRFFGTTFAASYNVAGPVLPIPEWGSSLFVLVLVTAGIVTAYLRYGAPAPQAAAVERLRAEAVGMPPALVHAFWVDDAIEAAIVHPAQALGVAISRFVDPHVIDAGVRDLVWIAGALGVIFRKLQTGLVRGYALTIVIGAALFIAYFATLGASR
jgi:NADH-quinone oxidoreductase subunit L